MKGSIFVLILFLVAIWACLARPSDTTKSEPDFGRNGPSKHEPAVSCEFDFRNFTYPSVFDRNKSFTLADGRLEPTRGSDGHVDQMGYKLAAVYYSDVYGDSSKEALITIGVITGGSDTSMITYVYAIEVDGPRLLWKHLWGDRADEGLRDVYVEEGSIVIETYEPSAENIACCPKEFKRTFFRWAGNTFVKTKSESKIPNPDGTAAFHGKNLACV